MDADRILAQLEEKLKSQGIIHKGITIRNDEMFELTVEQLKAAVAKNPDHPLSGIFLAAVLGSLDNELIVVNRVDLEAVILDKQVRLEKTTETKIIGGKTVQFPVETKYLED